jgi:hypothetical protein
LISDSDIEEIAPPSISNEPEVHTQDATIANPEFLQSIEDSIECYHTLSLAPAIPTHSPIELPSEISRLSPHRPPIPLLAGFEDEDVHPTWVFQKDRGRAAEVASALYEIVKARHRKQETTNLWVQSRIGGMLALCRLYSHPNSTLSWTLASDLAAKTVGHGSPTYARKLRRWVIEFERQGMGYTSLPLTQHGRFDTRRLLDEDISTKIHEHLLKLRKDRPFFKAEDIVDYIATPEMQVAMGTKATAISTRTAQRWLKGIGWRYGEMSKGMYIDGHERKDVVEYRAWFLAEYKKLERRMRRYDGDGNIEKLPDLQEGERVIREVTHDESTFYANDRRKQGYWHPEEGKKPVRKDEGTSIMVADFLTPEIGRLRDETRCAQWNGCSGVADSPLCSVKLGSSSKQANLVMGTGRMVMSSHKHTRQSKSLSASGLGNKAYFCMIMQPYTRNDQPVLSQQRRCPGVHSDGSPVLAQGCATGNFLMARLSHCIIPMTTQPSLVSSKGWNKFYVNAAFSPPIER